MKYFVLCWASIIVIAPASAQHFGFSSGLYRLPYATATIVEVGSDVYTHSPVGKYDLITGASNPVVVASADGWVRWIQESFDTSCVTILNGNITSCCWEFNNYVVIEHPNGEWSQYTHMDQNSVSDAGVVLNQWITAGTPIGTEGTVGCSTGDHVHMELSRPFDASEPFDTIGGFLNERASDGTNTPLGEMLIPVIGGIGTAQSWMEDGDVRIAAPLVDNCPASLTISSSLGNGGQYVGRADQTIITNNQTDVVYASGSSAIYRAGDYVRMLPGFHATGGAKFTAIIRSCNQQN
jgi:murein DD-endopeptidase MepM/ murein hydrolase activator NlpD